MNLMSQAIYSALYVEKTVFSWVQFTPFETIRGNRSRDLTKAELGIQ